MTLTLLFYQSPGAFAGVGAYPVNIIDPAITSDGGPGAPEVGDTLTCDDGTWQGDPTITYTYQWCQAVVDETDAIVVDEYGDPVGVAIEGQTDSEYNVDEGPIVATLDPFVFIDSVSAGASSGGSTFSTGAIDSTGATFLIIAVSDYSVATTAAIVDSKGNTYTGLTQYTHGGDTRVQIWYCAAPIVVGSGHTATITSGGSSNFASATLAAFSGPTAAVFDAEAGAGATSATASPGSGITPSGDSCLVITCVSCPSPNVPISVTPGSPTFFIQDIVSPTGNHFAHAMAYSIQTTAAAADVDWDLGSTINWATTIASFLPEAP